MLTVLSERHLCFSPRSAFVEYVLVEVGSILKKSLWYDSGARSKVVMVYRHGGRVLGPEWGVGELGSMGALHQLKGLGCQGFKAGMTKMASCLGCDHEKDVETTCGGSIGPLRSSEMYCCQIKGNLNIHYCVCLVDQCQKLTGDWMTFTTRPHLVQLPGHAVISLTTDKTRH